MCFQLFFLRPAELQRVDGPNEEFVLIPKPGTMLRAQLRYPGRSAIAEIGERLNMHNKHGSNFSDDWTRDKKEHREQGYSYLRDSNIHVLLKLSSKSSSVVLGNSHLSLPLGNFLGDLSILYLRLFIRLLFKLPLF